MTKDLFLVILAMLVFFCCGFIAGHHMGFKDGNSVRDVFVNQDELSRDIAAAYKQGQIDYKNGIHVDEDKNP